MEPRVFRAWAVAVILAGAIPGCKSASGGNQAPSTSTPAQSQKAAAASAGKSDDPRIILQCAADKIQKPPFAFHWSLKKNVSDSGPSDREADITPDSIIGTVTDSSGMRSVNAPHSDASAWNMAALDMAGPLPASTVALVNNSSATTLAGTEKMNGEDTIKYSIDTAGDTPEDASLIKSVLGDGGFVKGSAWVTAEGCPVKLVLDVEQHLRNGKVETEHYEEAMIRK